MWHSKGLCCESGSFHEQRTLFSPGNGLQPWNSLEFSDAFPCLWKWEARSSIIIIIIIVMIISAGICVISNLNIYTLLLNRIKRVRSLIGSLTSTGTKGGCGDAKSYNLSPHHAPTLSGATEDFTQCFAWISLRGGLTANVLLSSRPVCWGFVLLFLCCSSEISDFVQAGGH